MPRDLSARPSTRAQSVACELAVVVPTFNEHDNVPELLQALEQALCGIEWEVVFVDDDSSDATAD
jgi:dolichol-phosphate mannosyltransferase